MMKKTENRFVNLNKNSDLTPGSSQRVGQQLSLASASGRGQRKNTSSLARVHEHIFNVHFESSRQVAQRNFL